MSFCMGVYRPCFSLHPSFLKKMSLTLVDLPEVCLIQPKRHSTKIQLAELLSGCGSSVSAHKGLLVAILFQYSTMSAAFVMCFVYLFIYLHTLFLAVFILLGSKSEISNYYLAANIVTMMVCFQISWQCQRKINQHYFWIQNLWLLFTVNLVVLNTVLALVGHICLNHWCIFNFHEVTCTTASMLS